jgi:DNA-binding MarR family transcriptional regulator
VDALPIPRPGGLLCASAGPRVGPVSDLIERRPAADPCETAIGAGFDELEMAAWAGFLRAHVRLVRELDDELTRAHGLPLSSYDVLVQLANTPEQQMRLSQLADAVLLSRSGLSRLVARLVEQGLVERIECADDARGAFAVLTRAGSDRLEAARETHRAGVRRRFLGRLSETQQRQLAAAWDKLLD